MNNPLKPIPQREHRAPWTERALCADAGDPDLWFPDNAQERAVAKRICGFCPIRQTCEVKEPDAKYGVWGGLDRRRDRRSVA